MRTLRYCIKEGIINTYRNKLMTIASVSTIAASLILFGVFIVISTNIEFNSNALSKQPEIQAFCKVELDNTQIMAVFDKIVQNSEIISCDVVSKQDAFKKAKELIGNEGNLLDDLGYDFLPVSFIIKVKNPQKSDLVAIELKSIPGIETVEYSQKTIYIIGSIVKWVKYFSGLLMVLFSIVSIVIISNTVRLAVFARRREINIMKYIGATDWFIRWPFIVEGIIIGMLGSAIGYAVVVFSYNYFTKSYSGMFNGLFKFLEVSAIGNEIILFYTMVGILVGAIGSAISIRKYLKV